MIGRVDISAARPAQERDPKLHQVAVDFERQLVEQLAKQLVATAQPAGDEGSEQSAASGLYRDLIPQTLADAVSKAGGIGLAPELERSLGDRA
jgi:Rod binding domain-containing protein